LLDVSVRNALRVNILQSESDLLGDNAGIVVIKVTTMRLSVREEIARWCKVGEYVSSEN
jgi:hypothetical protein